MPTPRSLTTAPHRDFELEVVSGEWPTDISGEALYSSPQALGDLPYRIFDFGAMCRLSLEPGTRGAAPGRFAWQTVSIETPGKRLWNRHPEAFTGGVTGYLSPFGPPNSANTAPLPWGDRLFATWDGGRPVELHPETLEFVAEVGHVDSWGGNSLEMGGVLPFLLSSAHPVADPERDCLWSVKLDVVFEPVVGMRPSLVCWDREDGTRVRHWPLEGITFDGSAHTVSQTRDWVILSDSGNFKADAGEMFGGERTATIEKAVPVWLIRKEALDGLPSGTPVTPVCFTMAPPSGHYYARWVDTDGISVVWEGMDLMDLGLYLRPDDLDVNGRPVDPAVAGLYNTAMAPETITEVVFDPESGKVLEQGLFKEDWTFNLQLSAMDWSTEGMGNPTLHHVDYQGCRPGSISARAAALYEGRIDLDRLREETPGALCSFERGSMALAARWEYPDTSDHITSPTFAPRSVGSTPGASAHSGRNPGGHDGYVVQPVCSDDGLRIELFDAARVGDGPIATLMGTNKEAIPLILHSAWSPAHHELVEAERLSFSSELTEAALGALPDELRASVHEVAAELDGC
ncbi:MAG TPA: carotenoid oxygenase family protein [Acidimicrobiales bacterium]|nr:carotenoid oxygenase family protein [Acidimicrobiales bacterium]